MITRLEERLSNLARICTYGEYNDIIENGKLSEEYKEYYDIFKFLKDTELYCNPYTKEMVGAAVNFIEDVKNMDGYTEEKYAQLKEKTSAEKQKIIDQHKLPEPQDEILEYSLAIYLNTISNLLSIAEFDKEKAETFADWLTKNKFNYLGLTMLELAEKK